MLDLSNCENIAYLFIDVQIIHLYITKFPDDLFIMAYMVGSVFETYIKQLWL